MANKPSTEDLPPTVDFDPEVTYTPEQRRSMNKVARAAAVKEWQHDPNRLDPKHTQDRMTDAVGDLRERMGLPRDG